MAMKKLKLQSKKWLAWRGGIVYWSMYLTFQQMAINFVLDDINCPFSHFRLPVVTFLHTSPPPSGRPKSPVTDLFPLDDWTSPNCHSFINTVRYFGFIKSLFLPLFLCHFISLVICCGWLVVAERLAVSCCRIVWNLSARFSPSFKM